MIELTTTEIWGLVISSVAIWMILNGIIDLIIEKI